MRRATLAWIGLVAGLTAAAPGQGAAPEQGSEPSGSADLSLITLSTPAPMPAHAWGFRLTHRFATRLEQGSFRDVASGLFGLDGGTQIGLELEYGLTANTRLSVYRTSDRTIAFSARHELLRQRGERPSLALVGSIEGLDNFSQQFSPGFGAALAATMSKRVTFYAQPTWIGHTNLGFEGPGGDRSTVMLGLGTRLRLAGPSSLVAEWTPRLAGYKGRLDGSTADHVSFGIATDVGGHSFQLNVSNHLGTTPAQVARGQQSLTGWFLGFNLVRRFY
jgi:hypothetical protein